ncbi:MAG: hypothetical protein HFH12_12045 [Dorea sp.]|nr:hypothetical protein [Dorea sp.]
MRKKEKYTGSLPFAIGKIFLYGIILGYFLNRIEFALVLAPGNPVWWLHMRFPWVLPVFWGMLLAAAGVLLGRTVVEITDETIRVGTILEKELYRLDQFDHPVIERKEHVFIFLKFISVKCFLVFQRTEDIKRRRLHGFREKDMEKTLSAIRIRQARQLMPEKRIAIAESYGVENSEALISGIKSVNEFGLPTALQFLKEKKTLGKISLIFLGIGLIVGWLDVRTIMSGDAMGLDLFFITLAEIGVLLSLPVLYIRLYVRSRICAERIIIDGNSLQVNGKVYPYSAVRTLEMTSPRKVSDSIFPVQYYMYIVTAEEKKKYWIGSAVSFPSYEIMCRRMEQAMIYYPDKLKYIS